MSVKSVLEEVLGFALAAGEQLVPVYVHNPKSQQVVQILTPDVNALIQLLTSQATTPAA